MAYTEELGNYSCPDPPRRPDPPCFWARRRSVVRKCIAAGRTNGRQAIAVRRVGCVGQEGAGARRARRNSPVTCSAATAPGSWCGPPSWPAGSELDLRRSRAQHGQYGVRQEHGVVLGDSAAAQHGAGLLGHPAAPESRAGLLGHPAAPESRAGLLGHPAAPEPCAGLLGHPAAAQSRAGLLGHPAAPDDRGVVLGDPAAPESRAGLLADPAAPRLAPRGPCGVTREWSRPGALLRFAGAGTTLR